MLSTKKYVKQFFVLIGLSIFLPILGKAQSSPISITADIYTESKYMFRGVDFLDQALYYSLTTNYRNFYGSIWYVDDLKNIYHETDWVFGYNRNLTPKWNTDLGITEYTYTRSTNTTELYLTNTFFLHPAVQLSVMTAYDFTLNNFLIEPSANYSFNLNKLGFSFMVAGGENYLETNASLYGVYKAKQKNRYSYVYTTLDASYTLTKTITINAGLRFSHIFIKDVDYTNRGWYMVGLSYSL